MHEPWSEGYFTQCPYYIGYYREQSPTFQRFCLLLQGYDVPEGENYCELGFGMGLTVNMHAAATPGNWYGTDFSTTQVSLARSMASACDNKAHLFDEAFADFCHRTDLPEFDYISLHGIWSWITEENRTHIRHLLNKRLKNGGVAYVSYNALPGSQQRAAVRNIMNFHDKYLGHSQGAARALDSLAFAREVLEKQPNFLSTNPGSAELIQSLQKFNPVYLAHEYLNGNWDNLHFLDVADYLGHARLNFAASAQPQLNIEGLGYTQEALDFLAKIDSPLLREQMRDYFCNTSFRRDLFMRGGLKLTPASQMERLLDTRIMLCVPPYIVHYSVDSGMGTVNLAVESHAPIIEMLATDNYSPKTLRQLCASVPEIRPGQIVAAMGTLCGTGWLAPCQSTARTTAALPQTRALNKFLMQRACVETDVEFLVSPLLGAALSVPRLTMLFMLYDNAPDPAGCVLDLLHNQNEKLVQNNKELTNPEEERAVLNNSYAEYIRRKPIYSALILQ